MAILALMALWLLAHGCATAPTCEAAALEKVKRGVVLECKLGRDEYGHPAQVCLVAKPTGGTAAVAIASCRP